MATFSLNINAFTQPDVLPYVSNQTIDVCSGYKEITVPVPPGQKRFVEITTYIGGASPSGPTSTTELTDNTTGSTINKVYEIEAIEDGSASSGDPSSWERIEVGIEDNSTFFWQESVFHTHTGIADFC